MVQVNFSDYYNIEMFHQIIYDIKKVPLYNVRSLQAHINPHKINICQIYTYSENFIYKS